jgi:hypothetical protein
MMVIDKFVGGPCHGLDIPANLVLSSPSNITAIDPRPWPTSPLTPTTVVLTYRKARGVIAGEPVECWVYPELDHQELVDRLLDLIFPPFQPIAPRERSGEEIMENLRQAYALIEQIDRDERIAPLYYDPITRPPERWRGRDHDPFTAPPEDWRVVALPSEGGWTDPTQREQYEQIERYLLDDDGNVSPDAVRFRPRSK